MRIIRKVLDKESSAYDTLRFDIFFKWCCLHGGTPSRTQNLLANSNVSRWFNNEYHKLELQFIAQVDPDQSAENIQVCYTEVTRQILHYYPRPEIVSTKKIKFYTQNYN